MKQIKTIAVVCAILLAASSCSKDKVQPNDQTNDQTRRLTRFSNTIGSPYAEDYEYDSQGRIVKEENNYDLTTYVYSGNTITIKEIRKTDANRQVALITANMDAQGRIISSTGVTEYIKGTVVNVQTVLEYNAEGYIVKFVRTDNGVTEIKYEYGYANGNLVSKKYYLQGVYKSEETTEYDLSKPDRIGQNPTYALGFYFNGQEGKTNKNLGIGGKLIQANNTISWTYNKVYEMDNQNFPVKMTISGGTWNEVWDYTYNK